MAVAVALTTLSAMANLASTISQMHLPGGVSGSVVDVADPLTDEDEATEIVRSWRAWEDFAERGAADISAPPGAVIAAWLALDSILLAPTLALLVAMIARRRIQLDREGQGWAGVARVVPYVALVYLFSDEVENVTTAFFIFDGGPHWLVRIAAGVKLVALLAWSVAFVVLDALGLASDDYSFPYVARWASGKMEAVGETASGVVTCAGKILWSLRSYVSGSTCWT